MWPMFFGFPSWMPGWLVALISAIYALLGRPHVL